MNVCECVCCAMGGEVICVLKSCVCVCVCVCVWCVVGGSLGGYRMWRCAAVPLGCPSCLGAVWTQEFGPHCPPVLPTCSPASCLCLFSFLPDPEPNRLQWSKHSSHTHTLSISLALSL